jgi:hypothetical protein
MHGRFQAAALSVSSAPCRSLPIRNVSAASACAFDVDAHVFAMRRPRSIHGRAAASPSAAAAQGRYIMFNQSTLHARDAAGAQSYSLRDVLCVAAKVLLPYAVMACILLLAR